jgi:hypothetical protein
MKKSTLSWAGIVIAALGACDTTNDAAAPSSSNRPGAATGPGNGNHPADAADAAARDASAAALGQDATPDAPRSTRPPPDPGADPNTDPPGVWVNATSNLAGMSSECGNVSYVAAKPDENVIITGVAQKGLWASSDNGATWHALGTTQGSAVITNRISAVVFDPDHPAQFWESGIYNGGGVYATTTNGSAFAQQGNATHKDSVSVDFTDPARKTLLLGAHEQKQMVHRSTDGGQTWNNVGAALPADTAFSSEVLAIDSQTHLVGCSGWGGGTSGIFRTTNGGGSWTQVSTGGGVGHPLRAQDGALYWFGGGGNGVVKSIDDGQTWTLAGGASAVAGPPIELPDGRLAALGNQKVMLSADHGATWNPVGDDFPFGGPNGLAYSAFGRAFFVWHFTCGDSPEPVPTDAIMRAHFDYKTQ